MNEIGSEFAFEKIAKDNGVKMPTDAIDYAFVFSGRTAIDAILENEPKIKKVMVPSYCCGSMQEPFLKRGIEISFYSVNYKNGISVELENEDETDALVWCNYFGYHMNMPDFSKFINRGGIVIEDITHSFFSKIQYNKQSSYLVASIRKWLPIICGGYCASLTKRLTYKPYKMPDIEFLELKKKAMTCKRQYFKKNYIEDKEEFLKLFTKSNLLLSEKYSQVTIDEESLHIINNIDAEAIYNKRIKNAKILHDELKDCEYIKLLFDKDMMDCPLFVPVIINNDLREKLRNYLISKKIYCPIHWPKPNLDCHSNLYDIELSLVCDQRYNSDDMLRIVKTIKEFEKKI